MWSDARSAFTAPLIAATSDWNAAAAVAEGSLDAGVAELPACGEEELEELQAPSMAIKATTTAIGAKVRGLVIERSALSVVRWAPWCCSVSLPGSVDRSIFQSLLRRRTGCG